MWKRLTENPEITIFPQILLPLIVILYFKLSIILINFVLKLWNFFLNLTIITDIISGFPTNFCLKISELRKAYFTGKVRDSVKKMSI